MLNNSKGEGEGEGEGRVRVMVRENGEKECNNNTV